MSGSNRPTGSKYAAGSNDIGGARRFQRQGRRQAVAELRGVGRHGLTSVAGVGRRVDHAPEVRQSRCRVEIVERLRDAEGEAGQLDEGAVRTPANTCGFAVASRTLRAATDGDVAAQGAELGLRAGISRDVTARLPRPAVVARPGVDVGRPEVTVGQVAVRVDTQVLTDPTADLEAGIGARDVIEPRTIQTANLHVLDRFGLNGKIGCLRPSDRNETRCAAEEKAFHHLHIEPPNVVSRERVRLRPVRQAPMELPLCSPLSGKYFAPRNHPMSNKATWAFHLVRSVNRTARHGDAPSVAVTTLSTEA